MDFYLVLAVDESKNVVARNGVTAVLKLVLLDVVVGNIDRLLAVELLRNHKQLCLVFSSFLLLASVEEGNEFAPATLVGSILAQ